MVCRIYVINVFFSDVLLFCFVFSHHPLIGPQLLCSLLSLYVTASSSCLHSPDEEPAVSSKHHGFILNFLHPSNGHDGRVNSFGWNRQGKLIEMEQSKLIERQSKLIDRRQTRKNCGDCAWDPLQENLEVNFHQITELMTALTPKRFQLNLLPHFTSEELLFFTFSKSAVLFLMMFTFRCYFQLDRGQNAEVEMLDTVWKIRPVNCTANLTHITAAYKSCNSCLEVM